MNEHETAYGIAGFLLHFQTLGLLIKKGIVSRQDAIQIVKNASNYRENMKPLMVDAEFLPALDGALQLIESLLTPLGTDRDKHQ